ncbi:MAG: hypothetical protein H8E12_25330 [Rhodobacteraceae bacterium]|nr:hypothetical protein [Paracoccaceae bacterium]
MKLSPWVWVFALIISCSLAFGQYYGKDFEDMSQTEKYMVYNSYRKSPTIATVLSLTIPTIGHAYAGNWSRGAKFFGGRILSIGVTFGLSNYFQEEKMFTSKVRGDLDRFLGATGVIGFIYFSAKEWTDASKEVQRYNRRIYKDIFGKEPPSFSLNLQPTYEGANLTLAYKFD